MRSRIKLSRGGLVPLREGLVGLPAEYLPGALIIWGRFPGLQALEGGVDRVRVIEGAGADLAALRVLLIFHECLVITVA